MRAEQRSECLIMCVLYFYVNVIILNAAQRLGTILTAFRVASSPRMQFIMEMTKRKILTAVVKEHEPNVTI